MSELDTKRCTHCRETKPVTAFSKCRNGYQSACRPCRNEIQRSRNIAVNVTEQQCRTCRVNKPAGEFSRSRCKKSGLQSECKACARARRRAIHYTVSVTNKHCYGCDKTLPASDFPRSKQRADGLRSLCRACSSIETRALIYKITPERVRDLVNRPNCEMCGGSIPAPSKAHIDHCHETGVVRGTLCAPCNKLLGCAGDSVYVLGQAIEYLIRTGTAKMLPRRAGG